MTNRRPLFLCRRRLSLWATGLCLGVASCALAPEDLAVRRASKELNCPSSEISVVERDDISRSLYDIGACGQRARYDCFYMHRANTQCVREPDPPRWDPDPTRIAPPTTPSGIGDTVSARDHFLRVCGYDDQDDCLYKDEGTWRRRPAAPPQPGATTYVH